MKTATAEVYCTYCINHLNLTENSHELENDYVHESDNDSVHDSELILAQSRIGQMENKINKDKSITHECNVLTNLLNPTKCAE